MRLGRADGNRETLLFDFPAIKLSSGLAFCRRQESGRRDPGRIQGDTHATLGYMVSVGRFWYLPTS
jgi:hypothetical protein